MAAHAVAYHGVARTFQTPSIPRGVSVVDVVASARFQVDPCGMLASVLRLPRYWRSRAADREHALLMLELVGLAAFADEEAGQLSLGMRRLVEVARALCAEPGLLLLDEPASGLSADEVARLGRVVRAAAEAGATVILIEHNFGFVTSVADTAHVLHLGTLLASGAPAELGQDPKVIASYLGEGSASAGVRRPAPAEDAPRRPMLSLEGAVSGHGDLRVLQGVSLDVPAGTIEVVLGRNGVGKTTLLSAIAGQLPLWEGRLTVDGEDLTKVPVYRRTARGVALVQEGKRIFRDRTILENLVLGTHSVDLGRSERRDLCLSLLDDFPVLKDRAHERAGGLSGGQQQMLAIAQALASRPRVLLLDEPSAGLAPSIVEEVFDRVRALADGGLTVVLVEQVADQALRIGDHLTVLDDGRVVASGAPTEFHDGTSLQEAYFGTTV
jgi:ABC-type branched-subunit amino acid transport system ATPase component